MVNTSAPDLVQRKPSPHVCMRIYIEWTVLKFNQWEKRKSVESHWNLWCVWLIIQQRIIPSLCYHKSFILFTWLFNTLYQTWSKFHLTRYIYCNFCFMLKASPFNIERWKIDLTFTTCKKKTTSFELNCCLDLV